MGSNKSFVEIDCEGVYQAQFRKLKIDIITGEVNPFIPVMYWLDKFLKECRYHDFQNSNGTTFGMVLTNNYIFPCDVEWYIQTEHYLDNEVMIWFNEITFYEKMVATFNMYYTYQEANSMLRLLIDFLLYNNPNDSFYHIFRNKHIKVSSRNTLLYKL